MDTIFALSTVRGKAGVAVIRVSGPEAVSSAIAISGKLPPERRAVLRSLSNPQTGEVIDQGLVLYFPVGESYTGENTVEYQIHGSIATQDALLRVLADQPGCRMAMPGEFTQRALEADRLDLSQVEGLADLIDAETEAQRRQAMRVMRGDLGERVARWRGSLVRALALIEATIDFADEELPPALVEESDRLIRSVAEDIRGQLAGADAAERIRDGFEVAIVGAPNAGKSTLLNAIAGREAAITSSIAGTTRDVLEVRSDISGLPVTFLDTAGLRLAEDEIEAIGIERARERAIAADLRIFLVDLDGDTRFRDDLERAGDLTVRTKADIHGGGGDSISARTGQGLDVLLNRVRQELEVRAHGATSVIRVRQQVALKGALESFEAALSLIGDGLTSAELVADELIRGIRSLDALVGRVDVEDLLDEIFSSFCIGK
ncbi:tRNA uridine-5-carboxymethylaminomethyl(34) synthesis GTPase MnmE [Oceanibium sediminis]|uniref:tRNA uridine-5-carboxymethylaminomethyl(34) synthesis GTPase MnmE n=1 Tax=Oceanibium sediminis TaxID=2026339 RepID=UPI000DD4AEFB|nr:tRNA uridine-5-carboxymethylaminomethyl(34) synthesis GTPase MnmE [Oceanibium sediminis]